MILKTASRYAFSRKNRHFSRSVRIAVTLALSVCILMTVISVMHALQDKRFGEIRDIKSFDIIADTDDVGLVRKLYPGCSVFLYWEEMVLSGDRSYTVRYIDDSYDGGLEYLTGEGPVLINYDHFLESGGSELVLTRLGEGVGKLPKNISFRPTGIFMTSMRSFDQTHIFLPSEEKGRFAVPKVAVKGCDDISPLEAAGIGGKTWKESESTLYSAFLLENFMMKTVLSILFLIVAISERQSVVLFLRSKRKERAEFHVLGLPARRMRLIFILSFMIIAIAGLAGGLLLSFVTIPLFEYLTDLSSGVSVSLSFDWGLYFGVSGVMLLLTVAITLFHLKREERLEITEVIHG